jgi:titin
VVGPSSLKVSWTAPTAPGTYPLAGYVVSIPVNHGESGGPESICETNAATTECTFGVPAGVSHDVFVNAVDDQGNDGVWTDPVASGIVPAPTVPATVPTKNGDLVLAAGSSGTIAPGKTVTVSGTGYAPGSSVSVVIYSTPQVLTTIVADAAGNFTVEVTVPAGLAAGSHTLVASGVDANGVLRYVTLPVTVTAAGTAQLAYTGADVVLPAIGGLVAVVVGGGLIVASRRRSANVAA